MPVTAGAFSGLVASSPVPGAGPVARSERPAGGTTPAARLHLVSKRYGADDSVVVALDEVSWQFDPGTFTAVMGPSGSGKTTLLQMVAGLGAPTSGEVYLGDERIDGLPEGRLAVLRRERVGFVFQDFNLIPALTAAENIGLPLRLARTQPDETWLCEITTRAGIADRLTHYPHQISGGQQQRVALCRALLTRPRLLCCDEPTGALDSESSREVMGLLRQAVDAYGQTLVLVTHDPIVAAYADRVIFLVDGRIVDTVEQPSAAGVAATLTCLVSAR